MKQEDLELFAYWAHESAKHGLLKCSSGNLSHRLDDGSVLISGTGSWLADIQSNNISILSIEDEKVFNEVKPSAEFRFHREILRRRPEINTILHFQAPSATTICCMDVFPDYNVIIEVPVYIGKICHVPFFLPGSEELANAIAEASLTADLLQLTNHGQVVCGRNYKDAIQKAVFFELACSVIINSNFRAKALSHESISLLNGYLAAR